MAQDSSLSTAVPVAVLEHEHSALEDAVIRYRKQLILVGVLAVVGTTGYFGSKLYQESKHRNAALAFTRAETVGELRAVASQHPGQSAAANALLKAALLLAQDGKPQAAAEALNKLLATYPQHPLADLATFRLAEVQLQQGATQDASATFQKIASTAASPYGALALLRIADLHWQEGKIDEATKVYQQILTKSGGDRLFAIAEQRLKQIKLSPPSPIDFVPEPTPAPGSPGLPNQAPPSAAALGEPTISTPGLLGEDPAPSGDTSLTPASPPTKDDSLLPPPALPPAPAPAPASPPAAK